MVILLLEVDEVKPGQGVTKAFLELGDLLLKTVGSVLTDRHDNRID
jgi:hypothetical protein